MCVEYVYVFRDVWQTCVFLPDYFEAEIYDGQKINDEQEDGRRYILTTNLPKKAKTPIRAHQDFTDKRQLQCIV